ncbi:MAG TPA: hypothetical protein ENG83_09335 [Nitrospirae bacterium]|nr:hypothetical protein BMS3Abin06_01322 [bacterium BMS3Abin06]HDH12376.1 hypothetical protein [Nitrospirota bacterium]HDZ01258.1 hypothetical protein [Nitrospirota bacterium]
MEEKIKILIAELDAQWREILKIYSSLEKKIDPLKSDMDNDDLTNSLAYKLHNLFSAYEDMFKLIARFFENQIEDITKYHTGLLKRMLIGIEGVRPNLLSESSYRILDELRGFRHVFRHAYSYELDAERVIKMAEKSIKLKDGFLKDFKTFKTGLLSSL